MAKITLTKKWLDTPNAAILKKEGGVKSEVFWCSELTGFYCRVSEGSKSWGVSYRIAGKGPDKTKYSFSTYPVMGEIEARKRALILLKEADEGRNPRDYIAAVQGKTMSMLLDYYIAQHIRKPGEKPLRAANEIIRLLKKDVCGDSAGDEKKYGPMYGQMAVADFGIDQWNTILLNITSRTIKGRNVKTPANGVFKNLRKMLKFAVQHKWIETNQLRELDMPFGRKKGKRTLSVAELKHLWMQGPEAFRLGMRTFEVLCVLSALGKRSDQVCGMTRDEVNWKTRIWTIPACRVKGEDRGENIAEDERVPLSRLAYALLVKARDSTNSKYLFPDETGEDQCWTGNISEGLKRATRPEEGLPLGRLGIKKFVPHDIRRTVGTLMLSEKLKLGITREQKYKALGHTGSKDDDQHEEESNDTSDKVYDTNEYLEAKYHALETWGTFLANLVGYDLGDDHMRIAAE